MSVEDRYRWLFRKAPIMAVSLSEAGEILDASDAWLTRFECDRESMVGLTPSTMATPETARAIAEEYRPLLRRTGRLENVPVDLNTASGEVVHCVTSALVERGPEGDYLRTVAIYTEVAEVAAIQSHYRRLYRATPAMLHTVDREGRLIHVSDRWLAKLGYEREEVIGRYITDFMAEESRRELAAGRLQAIIAEGKLDNAPRMLLSKSGELIEATITAVPDRNERGEVLRMLVALKDVTERNQAERQLRASLDENAQLKEELERERDYLREEVHVSMNFGKIIGESPALRQMLARVEAVAQTHASVLITGESGTGKELVAHVIHASSPRAEAPLVKVNCASIPSELFESEFFGHVKGAFTGAVRDRVGRFELAEGGTLFLDEVSEIPIELQGKLLRVLQENEFERVGDERTRTVDVRVIAATNRELEDEVAAGRFREDLYYRLGVFPIQVPPLRERGSDVLQLAAHFLERACKDFGHKPLKFSRRQIQTLTKYDWPGNVRELKNVIERAVILSQGEVLRLDLGMQEIHREPAAEPLPDEILTEEALRKLERENLLRAMETAQWRVAGPTGAAQILGLKPTTLHDRLRRFGIKKPRQTSA